MNEIRKSVLIIVCIITGVLQITAFSNKLEVFEKNGKYGIMCKGDTLLRAEYDDISTQPIFWMGDTVGFCIWSLKNGKEGAMLDLDKKCVMPCEYDKITKFYKSFDLTAPGSKTYFCKYFTIIVEKDGKLGLYDLLNGKLVIPCIYKDLREEGTALEATLANGKWGLYSYQGKVLVPVGSVDALRGGPYYSELYVVEKAGKYGAYKSGKLIVPAVFSRYEGVNNNYKPTKIFFEQVNKTNTGKTHYIYSISGRLIAKQFFYNDQQRALNRWWQRYAQ